MKNRVQHTSNYDSVYRRIRHHIASSKLRVPVLWLRHRRLRSCDVFLGSYPRSGSTWLRFNLFEILTGQPSTFDSVNSAMRGPGDHYRGLSVLPSNGRLIGTHEPYRADYKKAIYLVRDIRDVVSSEFWYEKERGFGCKDFDDYLGKLLQGRRKYGSWQSHVNSWINSETERNHKLLLIRYEDMRRSPETMLNNILDFLGIPLCPQRIRQAIDNNSLQKMRVEEDAFHSAPNQVRFPERPHCPSREEGRFIRKGLVGGWHEQLSQAQVRLIERYAGRTLLELGYPLSSKGPL